MQLCPVFNDLESKIGMEKLQIGNIVKAHRESSGVSREELAHRIGVATTTIYRWEKGQQAPKFTDILSVSKALDMSIADFSGDEEVPANHQSVTPEVSTIFQTLAKHSDLVEMIAQATDEDLEVVKGMLEVKINHSQVNKKPSQQA